MIRLVMGRLLGGTCVCLELGLECAMDRRKEERLNHYIYDYRKERKARLLIQCDYMRRSSVSVVMALSA